MANPTTLKTRIALRNDTVANWNSTNPETKLLSGEVAFGRLSGALSDYYEMRIGTGDKTWRELSATNLRLPIGNIDGLDGALTSVQTKFYEVSSFSLLPENLSVTNGSIGVVLETVELATSAYTKLSADGAKETTEFRTAYWFDTSLTSDDHPNGTWRQMDGNYKAENVYFTDNLKLTEQFGRHKAVATGYTLSCKNMSLDAVLKEAYAETKQPSVTQPTVSFTLEKESNSGEVGTTYTLPNSMTFKTTGVGSYTYGPATGVTMSAMISAEASTGMTQKSQDGLKLNNTLTAGANVTSAFTDTAATYNYRAEYTWTSGAVPLNNIGGAATVKGIQAKTDGVATKTYTATGYRKCFLGFRSLDDGAIDFSTLTAMTTGDFKTLINKSGKAKEWKTTENFPTSFTIPAGTNQTIIAVPSTYKNTIKTITALDPSKNRLQFFDTKAASLRNIREVGTFTMKGASADSASVAYDLWVRSEGSGQFGANTDYTVTFS